MRSPLRVCPQCGTPVTGPTCPRDGWATVPQDLVEGTHLPRGTLLLGRYVVGAFVGANGPIALHEGHDSQTLQPVRVAVVPLTAGATLDDIGRVQRAARELERLSHPNVARVLATGMTERGDLALVEEHIDAPTLAEVVRLGPIGAARTITLGLSLVAGLEAAHAAALAHHDLAPARVRVRPDGSGVITGLGLGDLLGALDPLAGKRATTGPTDHYRAPEQAHDRLVTRHADIYSLGAVLFEALTGHPYTGVGAGPVIEPGQPGPAPWTDAAIARPMAEVLARCLERKPWNRYDSAASVREALEQAREALDRTEDQRPTDLAALAWQPPVSEPATRPTARPGTTRDSGLLAGVPAHERDPFEAEARPTDEAPIAPIARPVVRHLPERAGGWWLVAALVGLIVTGLAMTRLKRSDSAATTSLRTLPREAVAAMNAPADRALAEKVQRDDDERLREAEALAQQELDEQQLLEAEELARTEAEQAGRRAALEREQREAAELAQLELEERLWLEGEELARAGAEERARAAQERERLDAERRAFEADARTKREADARVRREAIGVVPAGATAPDRATPARDRIAAPSPVVGQTEAAPTEAISHRAMLVTVPEGASVLVDGAPVGRTPLTLSWRPGSESSVWVMLEGYEPASLTLSDRQQAKMLRLELVARQP